MAAFEAAGLSLSSGPSPSSEGGSDAQAEMITAVPGRKIVSMNERMDIGSCLRSPKKQALCATVGICKYAYTNAGKLDWDWIDLICADELIQRADSSLRKSMRGSAGALTDVQ
jgi:hypothetical protein